MVIFLWAYRGFKHTHTPFLHPGVLSLQWCSGFRTSILRKQNELSSHWDAESLILLFSKQLLFEGYIHHKMAQSWKHDVHHIYFHCLILFLIVVQTSVVFINFSNWNKFNYFSVNSELKRSHKTSTGISGVLLFTLVTTMTWKEQCFCAGLIPAAAPWTSALKYMNFNRKKRSGKFVFF